MSYLGNAITANGCKRKTEVPHNSQELEDLCHSISEKYFTEERIFLQPINKKAALREGRIFLSRHFRLHKIWQFDNSRIVSLAKKGPITIGDLIKEENQSSRYIHPFDLKVVFNKKYDLFDGKLIAKSFLKEYGDEAEIVRDQASFMKIGLSSKVTVVTPPVYAHEITHSQLQSMLGSVRYYKNIELLPFFIELLCAYEMSDSEQILKFIETFYANEIVRYYKELKCFEAGIIKESREDLVDLGKYLSSTLSAINFFIEYYKTSPAGKKYILQEIQKIFDGVQDLEELTKKLGVTDRIDEPRIIKHLTR